MEKKPHECARNKRLQFDFFRGDEFVNVKIKLLVAAVLLVPMPFGAAAQSIDHGSLEMLFGEPVTTSATGKPQRVSEAPVPMEIVTAEDIRRTGATNIPDALKHVLSLDVSRWTTEGADVSVRGFAQPFNPRLLVLVNGRQVYSDHFGMVFWNAIPVQISEIRQIEVVKGPNTALFGFNAAIGVINIVTYNPMYDDVNEVRLIYGNNNQKEVTGVVTHRMGDKGGISISGSYFEGDAFDVDSPMRVVPEVNPETSALNVRGQFRVDEKSEFGFEASYSETDRAAFVPMFIGSTPDVKTFSVKGTYERDSKIGLVKANAYYNSLDHDTNVVGFGPLNYQNKIFVAQLEDLFKIGAKHSFRAFLEFRDNTYDGEFPLSPFTEGATGKFSSFSGSGMWDWAASDKLNITTSGRIDVVDFSRKGFEIPGFPLTNDGFDKTVTEYTFNAGAVYRLDDRSRLKFSAARGAKLMSLLEFATTGIGPAPIPGMSFIMFGDPDLGAAIAKSYNLGYTRDIEALHSTFEIDGFYTSLSKNVTVANFMPSFVNPPFMVAQPVDVGKAEQLGIEVELKGSLENKRWGINYSYIDANDKFNTPTTGPVFVGANFEDTTAKHRVNIHGGVTAGKFDLDLYGQYTSSRQGLVLAGPMTGFVLVPVPDLFTISGQLTYSITENLSVRASGVAINKDQYRVAGSDPVERQIYISLGYKW